ncbi:TraX family protein [Vallitaleaceae bacterium 9-2]
MTSNQLKWIAIITMIIDHVGAVLFKEYVLFRIIGRIAFPIFAFLLTEGFSHTHDKKKYALRLGVFALVSEIPFNLAFYNNPWDLSHQNIFFTLLIGLLCLWIYETWHERHRWLSIGGVYLLALLADVLRTDYGLFGVLLIFILYQTKTLKGKAIVIITMNVLLAGLNLLAGATVVLEIYAGLSAIFVFMYNGKKGKGIKYVFYLIYPFHLALLYLIKLFLIA